MRQVCAAVILLGMGMACKPAAAMHPLLTDDVATAEQGGFELETALAWSRDSNAEGQAVAGEIGLALTWGVSAVVDLGICTAYARMNADGAVQSGPRDSYVSLKWRFVDTEFLKLAAVPYLALPSGDEDKGLGSGKLSFGVNLVASRALAGDWNVNANAAWDHINYAPAYDSPDQRHDLWRLSVSVDTRLAETWVLAAEIGTSRAGASTDRNPAFATVGAVWSPGKAVDLSFGYRFALNQAETDHGLLLAATRYW